MPSDGTFLGGIPREPVEQAVNRKKEKAQTLEALTVIQDVISHFTERIDYRDSLEAIKPDLAKSVAMHQKVCEVNDMLKLALIEEKRLLEELIEIHAPNR